MKKVLSHKLLDSQAALWWLGQAGYILKTNKMTVVIDPYLTDAAAKPAPELTRLYPPPMEPEALRTDVYIVTHDHLDHLDPELISRYKRIEDTLFVAPRQAAKKLLSLGVPEKQLRILHAGESLKYKSINISGVFALPTSADVVDTTGYFVKFDNGRSFYHTGDTEYHPLVVASAPKNPEVMAVPINGKWGNPDPGDAALFAKNLSPRFVMPNHYDLMALNSENPETFKWFCTQYGIGKKCIIPLRMTPFVWDKE